MEIVVCLSFPLGVFFHHGPASAGQYNQFIVSILSIFSKYYLACQLENCHLLDWAQVPVQGRCAVQLASFRAACLGHVRIGVQAHCSSSMEGNSA